MDTSHTTKKFIHNTKIIWTISMELDIIREQKHISTPGAEKSFENKN